ncbi:hypothetical protein [Desulfonatronum lacustre]|nr:hypothetical protein [Desulfonatronum lacustre]SMP39135.1 hypothetical protein SAMN06295888_101213 [Desulfonatronum zhilinae]
MSFGSEARSGTMMAYSHIIHAVGCVLTKKTALLELIEVTMFRGVLI